MPTGAEDPDLLVDTSVAVALTVSDHSHHETTCRAVGESRIGLAGHAAFETFSVLTRLPPPARRTAATVTRLLVANFPHTRFLGAKAATELLDELKEGANTGGAVYDALVGAAAREHSLPLATRDLRASEVYRSLGVEVRLVR